MQMLAVVTNKTCMIHMAPTSPVDFDNTNSFVDRVGAMVNDVIVTNEVELVSKQMQKLRHFIKCFKLLRGLCGKDVQTKLSCPMLCG